MFCQKGLFGQKYLIPNLKWLFGQKWIFCYLLRGLLIIYYSSIRQIIFSQDNFVTTILLSNESALVLERFGSPLMAESFQACFFELRLIEIEADLRACHACLDMIQFANKSDLDFKEVNANFNFLGAKDPGFCFLEIFCMNGLQNAADFGESRFGSEFCLLAISLSTVGF